MPAPTCNRDLPIQSLCSRAERGLVTKVKGTRATTSMDGSNVAGGGALLGAFITSGIVAIIGAVGFIGTLASVPSGSSRQPHQVQKNQLQYTLTDIHGDEFTNIHQSNSSQSTTWFNGYIDAYIGEINGKSTNDVFHCAVSHLRTLTRKVSQDIIYIIGYGLLVKFMVDIISLQGNVNIGKLSKKI